MLGLISNKRNLIIMLMSIELILLAISLLLVGTAYMVCDTTGLIYTLMVLGVAAGETSIGIAILISYYRIRHTIGIGTQNVLRG